MTRKADITAIRDCLDNVGASTTHKPMGFHGLLQEYLYLYPLNYTNVVLCLKDFRGSFIIKWWHRSLRHQKEVARFNIRWEPISPYGVSSCKHDVPHAMQYHVLNKQSRRADKLWSSSLRVGLTTPHSKNNSFCYEMLQNASDLDGFFG
jgi:hypothetical protein